MSAISTGGLIFLIYHFIRKNNNDQHAVAGLFLKMVAGICLGLIYKYHYQGGDTFQYFQESATLANYFLLYPEQFFAIFFKPLTLPELADLLVFTDQPRALLFSKIVAGFYLLSGGNYWIISIFFSLINFLCIHMLVSELNKKFANITLATAISFYFLPTFFFWTSGLLKESLATGLLAIIVTMAIRMIRKKSYCYFPYWICFSLSTILLWELKYYYVAIAIPILLSLLFIDFISKWKKIPAGYLMIFFIIGMVVASTFHYNLGFSRVLDIIYKNYLLGINGSDGSVIIYPNFDGSLYGFLLNIPMALFSGLFRPMVFEASNIAQFTVGVENAAALVLLIVALWRLRLKKIKINIWVLTALIYIISLSIILAFASPNFGTLSRYKVAYWPFFVLVMLTIIIRKQESQKV